MLRLPGDKPHAPLLVSSLPLADCSFINNSLYLGSLVYKIQVKFID